MSAQADLRGAIVAALRADAALTAVIGADRVHDGAPRGAAIPFVDLGAVELLCPPFIFFIRYFPVRKTQGSQTLCF